MEPALLRWYLNETSYPAFLRNLSYPDENWKWAESCLDIIQKLNYKLVDLFQDRLKKYPEHNLFIDLADSPSRNWTYEEVDRYLKLLAGAFYLATEPAQPRVAIFSENHLDTACCDLACLFYDIIVSPLNPNFNLENLEYIFQLLQFHLVITDTPERLRLLEKLKEKTGWKFEILTIFRPEIAEARATLLGEMVRRLDPNQAEAVLQKRRRRSLTEVATVMFTSGSTGKPKGVSFSEYHLVSKRFARAAALPQVGENEVLLAFLPLYHTFGRYFELLGMIFWRGTYVFSGNPSVETLLNLFPRINPVGLVSVPVRWQQIYERCLEEIAQNPGKNKAEIIRSVVGSRLRWGISAAGYLDPRVFHFFENHGINLVSGFGLTEATGGLTMTPPGRYVDNTQGLPLPGVEVKLTPEGELLARGHYIARYLEETGPGEQIPYPGQEGSDYWLRTGDIFRVLPNGYYQIVDRIKDIYKNNKGQTIAPRKVEDKFKGVPGIKRVFLVGDGRPYNILLIVPDETSSEFIEKLGQEKEQYYRRIIETVNLDLAPYERVINFALLDRDFSPDRGELTAKGSLNRKNIVANLSSLVENLYGKSYVEFNGQGFKLRLPYWIFRDLGLLENDFEFKDGYLINQRHNLSLEIRPVQKKDRYQIGDLIYDVKDGLIDLGLLARQPYLWCGNQKLVEFLPVKEGWDASLSNVGQRVRLPIKFRPQELKIGNYRKNIGDLALLKMHDWLVSIYFGQGEEVQKAREQLEKLFFESENPRHSVLLRLRLEAMADHPDEAIRCWAYRLLILDQPRPNYAPQLETFVESGQTFLNEESIEEIASSALGSGRFEALRKRLANYRKILTWPAGTATVDQFRRIFKLLMDFALVHPAFVPSVAAELASWALHRSDPVLAAEAERALKNLYLVFRLKTKTRLPDDFSQKLLAAINFSGEFSLREKNRITRLLSDPTFLLESIRSIYGEQQLKPDSLASALIRVSKVPSIYPGLHLRVCVNTREGEHFDFRIEAENRRPGQLFWEKLFWYLALSEHYEFPGLLPPLASWRADLGAVSYRYYSRLTVEERIRDFASRKQGPQPAAIIQEWRIMYIKAMSVIYQAVQASDFRIIPGEALPENLAVEADKAIITCLGNLRSYEGKAHLIKLMVENFYLKMMAAYPWTKKILDPSWLFDAAFEVWEEKEAFKFLESLRDELEAEDVELENFGSLKLQLESYLSEVRKNPVLPVSVLAAIRKFKEWEMIRPGLPPAEREEQVLELIEEYDLDKKPAWIRFYFYRHTYFASSPAEAILAFEKLLVRMKEKPEKLPHQFLELSEIQSHLENDFDRQVFSRMVFPYARQQKEIALLKTGEPGQEKLIVTSVVKDKNGQEYVFKQTCDPAEIGQLYRLFLKENYPRVISQENQHLVLMAEEGVLVGGLCFRYISNQVVFMEGLVVSEGYKNRGLGRAMLRDFLSRMRSSSIKMVMTHYLIPFFFLKEKFEVDKSWGALVRYL
uniref:GNAT family N-acetyltransferase n=1 Tax=Candidatus Saccharicenans sp. TaxID=2819258 RepID=UPI00404AF3DD